MEVFYGVDNCYANITRLAFAAYWCDGWLAIPASESARGMSFGDPCPNVLKNIKLVLAEHEFVYYADQEMRVECLESSPTSLIRDLWPHGGKLLATPKERLAWIHDHSRLPSGSMSEEYPEQLMVATFLSPQATVLELGANIGRNTVTIATILDDDQRFVTLECDLVSANLLCLTRTINDLHFQVEASALSRIALCQNGWDTFPYEGELPANRTAVATITFPELQAKYQLTFDTIVADCEGALYYILRDEPTLLNTINMVILENDFKSLAQKQSVDQALLAAGLQLIYTEALPPGDHGHLAEMMPVFFQVWKR